MTDQNNQHGDRNDLEDRLRSSLTAEAGRARISPDALGRVRHEITAAGAGRRTDRRGSRPGVALGIASVAAAAAGVTALLAVPPLLNGPQPSSDRRPPAVRAVPTTAAPSPYVVVAELSAGQGTDSAVSLVLTSGPGGTALGTRDQLEAAAPGELAGERIGRPGEYGKRPGVCELRLTNDQTPTVRVRLAPEGATGCSAPYEFRLTRSRLTQVG